jgi:hypothetical protein
MSPEYFAPSAKPWNNGAMKRLRYFFAAIILLLALPMWRYLDMVAILSPFAGPLSMGMAVWAGIFLGIPAKLIYQKTKVWMILAGMLIIGFATYFSGSFSGMATTDPTFNHCGRTTYTSTVYPLRKILTDAYRDDLEARNQMCWVRKMIEKVPPQYDLGPYMKIVHERLMKPEIKYSSTLPLIVWLMARINLGSNESNAPLNIYDSLHFWDDHYTEHISARQYPVWNWPHSDYIKFEYGIIERHWQKFIDGLVLETK